MVSGPDSRVNFLVWSETRFCRGGCALLDRLLGGGYVTPRCGLAGSGRSVTRWTAGANGRSRRVPPVAADPKTRPWLRHW